MIKDTKEIKVYLGNSNTCVRITDNKKEADVIINYDDIFVTANVPSIMNIKYTIANILKKLGIQMDLLGYVYLCLAIEFVIKNPEIMIEGITKSLYPKVAKKVNTKNSNIERMIRDAISKAWNKGNDENKLIQDSVFKYAILNGKKPTNSLFITTVVERIKILISD